MALKWILVIAIAGLHVVAAIVGAWLRRRRRRRR
jgi:LPXTG-motif cell wall-anchored protein